MMQVLTRKDFQNFTDTRGRKANEEVEAAVNALVKGAPAVAITAGDRYVTIRQGVIYQAKKLGIRIKTRFDPTTGKVFVKLADADSGKRESQPVSRVPEDVISKVLSLPSR